MANKFFFHIKLSYVNNDVEINIKSVKDVAYLPMDCDLTHTDYKIYDMMIEVGYVEAYCTDTCDLNKVRKAMVSMVTKHYEATITECYNALQQLKSL